MESQPSNIEVKLNSHGRYVWNIKVNFENNAPKDAVELVKKIDNLLKDAFPDHITRANTRIVDLDE